MAFTLDDSGIPEAGGEGDVTVTFTGDVAILQMKCGENRLNAKFIRKINAALDMVERNHTCKALITTGKDKFYCNGGDVEWEDKLLALNSDLLSELCHRAVALFHRILTFPVPTVAAINGHAYGGGVILALVHDHRIMRSERGFFCFNSVHGRQPMEFLPYSVVSLLREKIHDPLHFVEIVFSGKRLTARKAAEMRVITAAFEGYKLLEEALKIANEAAGPFGLDRSNLQTLKSHAYRHLLKRDHTTSDKMKASKL